MGLREKVALLILFEFFVQIMYGQCVQHTNKWISSFQVPYKKYKIRKSAKPIQRNIAREGCVARLFNFPEVAYSLSPTSTSTLYSNQNIDLHSTHLPQLISNPVKYSLPSTNKPNSRKYKKNRKNSAIGRKNTKELTELPETASIPNTCLNNELFFPSVDYPLDVSDLWTPHYWNRFPQIQPENRLDIVDMSIITKSKKENAKIAKKSRKDATVNKILNSRTETTPIKTAKETSKLKIKNITTKSKQNATNCENYSNNASVFVGMLSNKERFTSTSTIDESRQCTTDSFPMKNELKNFQETTNTQDDKISPHTTPGEFKLATNPCVSRRQKNKDITDQASIEQVNLTVNVERPPYYIESSTSTTSNLISFLTTVAPLSSDTNENVLDNAVLPTPQIRLSLETNLCNSTEVENEYEDPQLPDEMGYTIMYPELFSSLSTSTMSPLDENKIDSAWMDPEFDNHTLNTYSDEVEQCYILVP